MASCATTTPTAVCCCPLRRVSVAYPSRFPVSPLPHPCGLSHPRGGLACHVALSNDVSSLSIEDEEAEMAPKIGRKVRVTVPLRVYHVMKKPDLDLNGLEGVIKQYVPIWKGKRISANLPFKVEFFIPIDGQDKPQKVIAHLREDEFEYVD